jgi:hypothetical protein
VRQVSVWYAGFAVYAAGVALFSGPGLDHYWGIWGACGYTGAAVLAWRWRTARGRAAALAAALAGALAGPVAWLALCAPATPDTTVVTRSAVLLIHHATPYLAPAQLAHGGWLAYSPYLAVMAVFGLPKALGLPGLAGDPRPWLAAATFLLLAAAFRAAAQPAPLRRAAFATASPVMAFPIALGITDPPVLALTCLTLALLARPTRPVWPAALVLGVACAMKYTAWPALAVLASMVAVREGARAAVRFATVTVSAAAVLAAAVAPASLGSPAALIQNTILFPLGLTTARSPAQSPLPGHLLATIGPAGHLAALILLITAGVAIVASLVIRPPADTLAAARRLALGLTMMFALSPATRFGYLAYPVGLLGWIALCQPSALIPSRTGNWLSSRPRVESGAARQRTPWRVGPPGSGSRATG